jgi:hypothetical protein
LFHIGTSRGFEDEQGSDIQQSIPSNARYSAINSKQCQIFSNQFQAMPDIQQSIPSNARYSAINSKQCLAQRPSQLARDQRVVSSFVLIHDDAHASGLAGGRTHCHTA